MKTIMIHGNQMTSRSKTIEYLKHIFEIEYCQGSNLDALWDCMGENRLDEETVIYIFDEESIYNYLGTYGIKVMRFINALPKLNDKYLVKTEEDFK
ncbi:MAG TPA: barstar family protein [Alloiococcus sp.]|nr:barstar family protein [Alloiococcus sp.]